MTPCRPHLIKKLYQLAVKETYVFDSEFTFNQVSFNLGLGFFDKRVEIVEFFPCFFIFFFLMGEIAFELGHLLSEFRFKTIYFNVS